MGEFLGQILGPLTQLLGVAQGAAGGGLPALLAQLENAGLGEQVGSWAAQGEQLPVTAEELATVLTPEQLNHLAEQAGTTPDGLLERLAQELPQAAAAHSQRLQATPPGEQT